MMKYIKPENFIKKEDKCISGIDDKDYTNFLNYT